MKMKTAFVGFLFAIFMAIPALAGFQAFQSTTNLGVFSQLTCSTGLTCSKVGGKLNIVSTNAGVLQNQIASSTTTLTSAQCGSTVVSNSADVVTLPEASTVLGCQYTFVCGTADDFDVNPADTTDVIGPVNSVAGGTGAAITPSAGDAIRCTDIGSSITLEAVGADRWVTLGVGNGAWTDVN